MKQLQHKLTTSLKILLFVAINLLSITQANARSWRVEQIPNGNKFNCLNCHYAPYGGPRNSFGVEVELVVSRGSNDSFWNSVLAAKDSDGDGSSNGEELGDPNGDGNPTDGANITNPSDPESTPQKPVLVSAEVILSGLRQTYDGSAKLVTVTTGPAGLNVVVTYTDSEGAAVSSPTEVGKYAVVARVSDENYKGSASGTLKIVKGIEIGGGNKGKPEIVDIVIENDKINLSVNFNEPFRWEKTRFESIKKFPQPWIGSPDTPHEIQLEEKGGMSWRQTDMVFVGNYRVLDKYEIEAAVAGYLLEIRGVYNPKTNLLNFDGLDYVPIFHDWPRTYQWEHNGKPTPGGSKSSLTIENATSKDSGLYRVIITNKQGSFTSDEVVLNIDSEVVDEEGSGEQKRPKWVPKIDTPLKVTHDKGGKYSVEVSIVHGAGYEVTDWGKPAPTNDGDLVVVKIEAFGPIPGKPYTKPLITTNHNYHITQLMTNVTGSGPSVFTMKAWGKVIASRELPLNEKPRPKWVPEINIPIEIISDTDKIVAKILIGHGAGYAITDWGRPVIEGDVISVDLETYGPVPGMVYTEIFLEDTQEYDLTKLIKSSSEHDSYKFKLTAWSEVLLSKEFRVKGRGEKVLEAEVHLVFPLTQKKQEGIYLEAMLYEYDPLLADAPATLVDQVEFKDLDLSITADSLLDLRFSAKRTSRMNYYVSIRAYEEQGSPAALYFIDGFQKIFEGVDEDELDIILATRLPKKTVTGNPVKIGKTDQLPESFGNPVQYPQIPTVMVAKVNINGQPAMDGDMVTAYVGDELRGKGVVVVSDGIAYSAITINVSSSSESATFKIWDNSASSIEEAYIDGIQTVAIIASGTVGSWTEPALLDTVLGSDMSPFDDPVIYPNNSFNILGAVTIDGKAASKGDVVAVYVGNELRGKQTIEEVYNGMAYLNILVNVDSTSEKTSKFMVWDADQTNKELQTLSLRKQVSIEPGGKLGTESGLVPFDFTSLVIQEVSLNAGWNLISFYVESEDMTPATVLGSITDKLVQIKNLKNSYNPTLPAFINTLKGLNVEDGYWVKMDADVSFDLEGMVSEGASIPVRSGWNLMGYPRESGAAPANELTSLGDTVLQFKNLKDSYNPALPAFINTLKVITPGLGYWLNVSDDGMWNVGDVSGEGGNRDISKMGLDESRWGSVVVYPNVSATVLAEVTVEGKAVSSGSVVGAFVGDELRGQQEVVLVEGKSYVSINVNLPEAEKVSFRIWDAISDREYGVTKKMTLEMGEMYGSAESLVNLDWVESSSGSTIRIVGYDREPFGFGFESQMGSSYVVEATGDLGEWGVIKTYNGTGTMIRFEEERDEVFLQIYYRVRVVE